MNKRYCERKPFFDKLNQLKASLDGVYNCKKGSYIISLSRKGPRMLEKIFEGKETKVLNTVTEFALPFLFPQIAREYLENADDNPKITLYIVDDAVYFGSTLEGLFNEIKTYEKLYGLDGKIEHKVFTCIKSRHSKPLEELDVQADADIPDGFEYYFIKNLTANLRLLNKCLEVEFPIVTYHFDEAIDRTALVDNIKEVFGESRTYTINYGNLSTDDAQVSNTNIILDSRGALFKKVRILLTDHEMRVACMAPCPMISNLRDFGILYLGTELWQTWKWILGILLNYEKISMPSDDTLDYFHNLRHNQIKTLVSLANYFESYNTLIECKDKLCSIFASMGYHAVFKGVDLQDLYYLLGDEQKCVETKQILDEQYEKGISIKSNVNGKDLPDIDYQVFEHGFPVTMVNDICSRNKVLLENCLNTQEALSLLFYNQMLILDNGTRKFSQGRSNNRLRFGYTFQSLAHELLNFPDSSEIGLHRWMDSRIDQGCIVPQYVHDPRSNEWIRVFRPGENEDSVLGQLARLVAFCYDKLDKAIGAGWVPKQMLSEVLSLTVICSDYEIERLLGIKLEVRGRELCFFNDNTDKSTNVMEYLLRMSVLSIEGDRVTVSESLDGLDVREFTSLGSEVDDAIKSFINGILEKAANGGLRIFELSAYTNLLFINREDISSFCKEYEEGLLILKQVMEQGKEMVVDSNWMKETLEEYFSEYYPQVVDYIVKPVFWDGYIEKESMSKSRFELIQRMFANFEMTTDMIFQLLFLQRYDGLEFVIQKYQTPSWGENVIDRDFINTIGSLYGDDNVKSEDRDLRFIEVVCAFLEKLKINA